MLLYSRAKAIAEFDGIRAGCFDQKRKAER
jgi:hypothetical protein